jgi:hypothetical protein
VNFFEDDEGTRVLPPPPARHKRKKRSVRIQRLVILIVCLFVVVLVLTLVVRQCAQSQKVSSYRTYFGSVQTIITDSNGVGGDLASIVGNPLQYTRAGLMAKLDSMVRKQQDVSSRAQLLKPPGSLASENQQLVVGMQVRTQGMKLMRIAIESAGGAKPSGIKPAAVSSLSGYFAGPDAYYMTLFHDQAQQAMQNDGVAGVTVPLSNYFLRSPMFGVVRLKAMLDRLASSGIAKGIHGVAVLSAAAGTQQLQAGRQNQVKIASDTSFDITVANQGTAAESAVLVSLTLAPPAGVPAPPQLHQTVDSIAAGKSVVVKFGVTGFNIGNNILGRICKLTAKAGPVPGEKITTNNSLEFTVVLHL